MTKIKKDMLIGDVVKKYPYSVNIMLDHGFECIGCYVATWETLEQGAHGHGVDVDNLVKELNKKAGVK